MKLLQVDSSAQTQTGQSRRLTQRVVSGLRGFNSNLEVTLRDLAHPILSDSLMLPVPLV